MKDNFTLKVFTTDRQIEINDCDTVIVNIAEDTKDRFSGSYGIRKGHAKAIFSLSSGTILALKNEKTVFSLETSDGFATVENDTVTVTVDSIKEI